MWKYFELSSNLAITLNHFHIMGGILLDHGQISMESDTHSFVHKVYWKKKTVSWLARHPKTQSNNTTKNMDFDFVCRLTLCTSYRTLQKCWGPTHKALKWYLHEAFIPSTVKGKPLVNLRRHLQGTLWHYTLLQKKCTLTSTVEFIYDSMVSQCFLQVFWWQTLDIVWHRGFT